MRYYIKDSTEKHVIVTHTDIGNISGVKVRFVRGDGIKATGSQHEVMVRYVNVESTENTNGYDFFLLVQIMLHLWNLFSSRTIVHFLDDNMCVKVLPKSNMSLGFKVKTFTIYRYTIY
jgi:hypothetical protein